MKTLPTHRQNTRFLDEDDTSRMETKQVPLRHAAAIQLFTKEFVRNVAAQRIRAVEDFIFRASGGHEPSDTHLISKDETQPRFPVPEGSSLIATSGEWGSTHLNLSQDGGTLTQTTARIGYFPELRSVALTPAQTAELLQTLANPHLEGNAGNPGRDVTGSSKWCFNVEKKVVAEIADRLGVDLTTKPLLETGWAVVERGALADTSVSGSCYPGLKANFVQLCASSAFRPGIKDDLTVSREGVPAKGEIGLLGIADLGEQRNSLTKRVLRNEAEPFITHFRRVDGGAQALALEQADTGKQWNATLFSEVLGVVVVKSASFGDKELLTKRMLDVADQVLAPEQEIAIDKSR